MPKFDYIATDKTNKRVSGTIEASSAAYAISNLQHRDLKPVSIQEFKNKDLLSKLPFGAKNKKIKIKDMVIFTRQLATMIDAGVPLLRSLTTLQTQTENLNFKKHIAEVCKEVEGGISFADALEKHANVFSPTYVNMVRAGETGGILDSVLKKLATQQEKDARIRGKFKSAMTYPMILITITLIVFLALMIFVMPRVGKIVKDLAGPNAELPKLTQVMLGISNFMVTKWYIMLAVFLIISYILRRYVSTPKGRRKKDQLLLGLPVISMIVRKVAIARFARIFSALLGAGVTVIESLEVTGRAIGNSVIEDELIAASKAVTNGQQLSVPISGSKVFPPIVSQMLAIGEETGKTDEILVKVAEFYEEEVDETIDSLSSILEPIMIVVMGAMVGLIAASVIGPISSLSSKI